MFNVICSEFWARYSKGHALNPKPRTIHLKRQAQNSLPEVQTPSQALDPSNQGPENLAPRAETSLGLIKGAGVDVGSNLLVNQEGISTFVHAEASVAFRSFFCGLDFSDSARLAQGRILT